MATTSPSAAWPTSEARPATSVSCSGMSAAPAWAAPVLISSPSCGGGAAAQVLGLVHDLDHVGAQRGHLAQPDEDVVAPVAGGADPEQQPAAGRPDARS